MKSERLRDLVDEQSDFAAIQHLRDSLPFSAVRCLDDALTILSRSDEVLTDAEAKAVSALLEPVVDALKPGSDNDDQSAS